VGGGALGSIYINPTLNKVNYSVDSKKDLTNLIIHLEKDPLLTQVPKGRQQKKKNSFFLRSCKTNEQ
jgi:hypothetical protein